MRIVLFTFCAFTNLLLFSQESVRNVFLELGGSGGLGSVNYEKSIRAFETQPSDNEFDLVQVRDRAWLCLRLGLGTSPIDKNNGWVIVTPIMVEFLIGQFNHKLELGAGLSPSVTTKGAFFIKSPLALGYRYCPINQNIFFRLTYTPIIAWLVDFQWQHWAGISIGYRFTHE